jgi:hypothetical protein
VPEVIHNFTVFHIEGVLHNKNVWMIKKGRIHVKITVNESDDNTSAIDTMFLENAVEDGRVGEISGVRLSGAGDEVVLQFRDEPGMDREEVGVGSKLFGGRSHAIGEDGGVGR